MQLIQINSNTIGNDVKDTVNARELYAFLEVKSEFRNWMKNRIEDFDFVENQDFVTVGKNLPSGGRQNDYHLTIDMAKELSMVERNDKGKQARQYFIECERRAKIETPEMQLARAVITAQKFIDNQNIIIAELKPKADFFDAVTDSTDAIEIGTAAKILNMGIGRNSLFAFLRDQKILQENNQPYQTHIDAGHFRIIEQKYSKPDGSTHINIKTVVYQKGLDLIRKRLQKHGGEK